MSQILIQQYLNELSTLRRISGTTRESVVSEAFKTLLKDWGKSRDLIFIPQYEYQTLQKKTVYPDGALVHELRVPFGYWEAKDEDDDLDAEIEKKFRRGYPQDNIIFEDSRQAILIQNKQQVMRCGVDNAGDLHRLLQLYFGYERKEIAEFRKAVEQFKTDLPLVLGALRTMIEDAHARNAAYQAAEAKFLKHAQETVNPTLGTADVREMLIQHILTEEIFAKVFDDSDFHTHNNIAKELYGLEATFFTGSLKKQTLRALDPYYMAIRASAAQISSHAEKQTFLKVIYENFYKVYNAKAADRLGVVYTPNEIVRFMIQGADWLCRKHFDRGLIDKNVEILDPATGTGTFIAELIEYFQGDKKKLAYKYREELHANEVAILPYYVANLNIESTYAAITRSYEEFQNLCFVDTLDNISPLGHRAGHQHDLFASFTEENVKRVKRQNARKISVILGNPPYNANQQNENDNNKNREYPKIDELIKATYIKASTAQKTKAYDMYARFFRWASDRLDINGDGIVAFITNRSFIESRTFDGFRKTVADEFNDIWIIDLGGDVRSNLKLSGTKHNVFGIQTGVAVSFLVRKRGVKHCTIQYCRRPEYETAEEKLSFLHATRLQAIPFVESRPDATNRWINLSDTDFTDHISLCDKQTKSTKNARQERSIFKLYSLGVVTARDEWVYDSLEQNLDTKVRALLAEYDADLSKFNRFGNKEITHDLLSKRIKWTRAVKRHLQNKTVLSFRSNQIINASYRPFVRRKLYFDPNLNEMRYQLPSIFVDAPNPTICFTDASSQKPFMVVATTEPYDYHLVGAASAACGVPLHRIGSGGTKIENITDWALNRFHDRYEKGKGRRVRPITKDAIFNYVYGVLHDPIYHEKYALDLKREYPRIPFYPDFWRWAEWGEALMALHIDYETIDPWPLERIDVPDEKAQKAGRPKVLLKADKDAGTVQLDSETQLTGIPAEAWTYRLGNRSALEWILDQHKEKTPKDPTIREKFNTYRFADHKEKVIDLLKRVTHVSVETMRIVEAMRSAAR